MSAVVVLWSRPGCGACTFTSRSLTSGGVPVEVRNLDFFPEDAERLRLAGHMGLPVVEPNDDRYPAWSRLKLERIKELTEAVKDDTFAGCTRKQVAA